MSTDKADTKLTHRFLIERQTPNGGWLGIASRPKYVGCGDVVYDDIDKQKGKPTTYRVVDQYNNDKVMSTYIYN